MTENVAVKEIRNPNRLYDFYRRLESVHIEVAPDLRFGQLIDMIFNTINSEGKDPFYLEEDEIIKYFEKLKVEEE